MLSVHKTQRVAGVGSALIIICDGERDDVRFAEAHVILPQTPCRRISRRLLTQMSRDVVPDDDLRNQALNYASGCVQSEADEQARVDAHQIAPAVTATLTDDGEIRALRYAGICKQQLVEIATVTLSIELEELIRKLWYLPVISVEEL
jgi:hypothetical protein